VQLPSSIHPEIYHHILSLNTGKLEYTLQKLIFVNGRDPYLIRSYFVVHRVPGQGTEEERKKKDFRKELEEKERASSKKDAKALLSGSGGGPPPKKAKIESGNLDADDPIDQSDGDTETESSDDEDDTAALMAELQRIKKERAAEAAKKEAEKRAEEERIRAENILSGNPLLSYTSGGSTTKADMKVNDSQMISSLFY